LITDIQTLSLIATIVLAFVGYWVTHRSSLELTKRKEQLELVDKRLNEFYGPLYISLLTSTAAFKTLNSELLGDQPFSISRISW